MMRDYEQNTLEVGDHVRVALEPLSENPAMSVGEVYQVDEVPDPGYCIRLETPAKGNHWIEASRVERVIEDSQGNWVGVGDTVLIDRIRYTVARFARDTDPPIRDVVLENGRRAYYDDITLVDGPTSENEDAEKARSGISVYVAGPYSEGDLEQNIRQVIFAAEILVERGRLQGHHVAPWIPHLNKLWDDEVPHEYEFWLDLDFVHLSNCDACFRVGGHSPGADREKAVCEELGIPYFTCFKEYEEWLTSQS